MNNAYKVYWKGIKQPLGSNSYHSARMYILHCLAHGGCNISQFRIIDNWGEIKTAIIKDKDADPTLSVNYSLVF